MSTATPHADPTTSYVFYWKGYLDSIANGPDLRLSSNAHAMRTVKLGDVIWSFTETKDGFVIAARFIVDEVNENPGDHQERKFGHRYAQSTINDAVYFSLEGQSDITDIMVSAKMVEPGSNLGSAFNQAMRQIKGTDQRLAEHARSLQIDQSITSELAIERWLNSWIANGEGESVPGLPLARREVYLERTIRNQQLVTELKRLYGGRCQVTGEMPLDGHAGDITEAHHIVWLLRGGPDCRSNMVVLSPDMHTAIHATDASFDWSDLAFVVRGKRFRLVLNHHLTPKP